MKNYIYVALAFLLIVCSSCRKTHKRGSEAYAGSGQIGVGISEAAPEPSNFPQALGSALQRLERESLRLVAPFYLDVTNTLKGWRFHFVHLKGRHTGADVTVFVQRKAHQRVDLLDLSPSLQTVEAVPDPLLSEPGGMPVALENALLLLRSSGHVDSLEQFSVTVGTEYLGEPKWLFVFRMAPWNHKRVAVVVERNGEARINSTTL